MKIGLIDVDGHNFPNFALMKLSAWHKRHGDDNEYAESYRVRIRVIDGTRPDAIKLFVEKVNP